MLFRFASRFLPAALLFCAVTGFAQSPPSPDAPASPNAAAAPNAPTAKVPEIQPDPSDPGVVRAQANLEHIQSLVRQGILPPNDAAKAQDALSDALDLSILRAGTFSTTLLPEQADQMVAVAQELFDRRQKRQAETLRMVQAGILARSEAEKASSGVLSAKTQLDLATERARLLKDLALQQSLAEAESDAESHPEWNGKLYTRYDGNGVFTRADFNRIAAAFLSTFGHQIPVSADGQTAVHTALGFNHAGRIDIALNPDQPEGVWLLNYLRLYKIPYYAFRAAIAHKATGAHIHLGPGSTRLVATKACCATRAGY